ncbi:MAG: hypothetical protein ACXABY_19215 [Candidatus Thorarchaeota archaeon]|jgi:hypothetical protein
MDWILITVILVGSIVACWAAQEFVVRKNIKTPKTVSVIGHIFYGLLLVLAFIYM